MFVYAPPPYSMTAFELLCHCDLDLWTRNSKFERGHLLVMTNQNTNLEDPWSISPLVIYRTNFDMCKSIYHHFFEGGTINQWFTRCNRECIIDKSYCFSSKKGHHIILIICLIYYLTDIQRTQRRNYFTLQHLTTFLLCNNTSAFED